MYPLPRDELDEEPPPLADDELEDGLDLADVEGAALADVDGDDLVEGGLIARAVAPFTSLYLLGTEVNGTGYM